LPAPWASGPACSNLAVLCQRLPRLFAHLDLATGDGRFPRLFRSLVKAELLILEDWGPERLNAGQRRDLMEIVEDRIGRGSIRITSQLPVTAWHDVIDEPTFADAILDRVRRRPSGLNRCAAMGNCSDRWRINGSLRNALRPAAGFRLPPIRWRQTPDQ